MRVCKGHTSMHPTSRRLCKEDTDVSTVSNELTNHAALASFA